MSITIRGSRCMGLERRKEPSRKTLSFPPGSEEHCCALTRAAAWRPPRKRRRKKEMVGKMRVELGCVHSSCRIFAAILLPRFSTGITLLDRMPSLPHLSAKGRKCHDHAGQKIVTNADLSMELRVYRRSLAELVEEFHIIGITLLEKLPLLFRRYQMVIVPLKKRRKAVLLDQEEEEHVSLKGH